MNCQEKHNELEQAMEELNAKGFDGMGSGARRKLKCIFMQQVDSLCKSI